MRDFQHKRGWRNIVRSKPFLVLLGAVVALSAWSVKGFMVKMRLAEEKRQVAEIQLRELEDRKAQLSKDIANLETESGVEENIREKFGLAKDGEGLVIVVDDKEVEVVVEEADSWFEALWKKIFK